MTKEIKNRLDELGVKYSLNEQLYDYSKLKNIIVGDNPGKKEFETGRFFIGQSGQKLRSHLKSIELIETFYKQRVEKYVRQNQNHLTIHRLRNNIPITHSEFEELEKLLFDEDEAPKVILKENLVTSL